MGNTIGGGCMCIIIQERCTWSIEFQVIVSHSYSDFCIIVAIGSWFVAYWMCLTESDGTFCPLICS